MQIYPGSDMSFATVRRLELQCDYKHGRLLTSIPRLWNPLATVDELHEAAQNVTMLATELRTLGETANRYWQTILTGPPPTSIEPVSYAGVSAFVRRAVTVCSYGNLADDISERIAAITALPA